MKRVPQRRSGLATILADQCSPDEASATSVKIMKQEITTGDFCCYPCRILPISRSFSIFRFENNPKNDCDSDSGSDLITVDSVRIAGTQTPKVFHPPGPLMMKHFCVSVNTIFGNPTDTNYVFFPSLFSLIFLEKRSILSSLITVPLWFGVCGVQVPRGTGKEHSFCKKSHKTPTVSIKKHTKSGS